MKQKTEKKNRSTLLQFSGNLHLEREAFQDMVMVNLPDSHTKGIGKAKVKGREGFMAEGTGFAKCATAFSRSKWVVVIDQELYLNVASLARY